jgi:hypothetical protein
MRRVLLPSTLAAVYFSHAFRLADGSPARAGLGDWLDPYFINYLLEHWYYCVTTLSDPRSPLMFFPVRDTLGYSHSLILYAPFYIVARLFLDPFQAYSLMLGSVLVLGTICLYLLLRQVGLRFLESLALTAFFATSGNIINGMTGTWTQTASVFLIPPVLLMLVTALRRPPGRTRSTMAFAGGLLSGLVFSQEYYTGAFAVLILILLVALPVLVTTELQEFRRTFRQFVVMLTNTLMTTVKPPGHPSRLWLVLAAGFAIVAAILVTHPIDRTAIGPLQFSARDPWRSLYVGLLAALWFAGRRWRFLTRLQRAAASVRDGGSACLAALIRALQARVPRADTTFLAAFFAGIAVSFVVFLVIYLRSYLEHPAFPTRDLLGQLKEVKPSRWTGLEALYWDLNGYYTLRPFALALVVGVLGWSFLRAEWRGRRYCLWFLSVSALILILPLRIGDFSPWNVVFGWWPGLRVIRGVARIIYLYELALVFVTAFLIMRVRARPWCGVAVIASVVLLLIVDWNSWTFEYQRPRLAFQEWVLNRIDVDRSCRSFFIKGASQRYMSRADDKRGLYNIDAMFIALKYSIPTLNGYSAWAPRDWGLANPHLSGYTAGVNDWIDKYALQNVCMLDIDSRTMTPYAR